MIAKKLVLSGLCLVGVAACATPARNPANELIVGMSADQVIAIMGDPAKRSSRDSYKAWRYEDAVRINPCRFRATGCRRACKHTLVWFYRDVLVSMTGNNVSDLAECGSGSDPVNWDLMPDYALLCYHDGLKLPRVSESCFGSRAPAGPLWAQSGPPAYFQLNFRFRVQSGPLKR